jgi:hypothetical protein
MRAFRTDSKLGVHILLRCAHTHRL